MSLPLDAVMADVRSTLARCRASGLGGDAASACEFVASLAEGAANRPELLDELASTCLWQCCELAATSPECVGGQGGRGPRNYAAARNSAHCSRLHPPAARARRWSA